MRKLISGSELFKETFGRGDIIGTVMTQQLSDNIGIIAPEHISVALAELKDRARVAHYGFLFDAQSLYKERGLIRLFNLSNVNGGRSKIPAMIPFFPGIGRNRVKASDMTNTNGNGMDRVIYVNMYRIGNWSADGDSYIGVSAMTDLYSCLESGVMAYKLFQPNDTSKRLFSDPKVLEYLVKIYTYMFGYVAQKVKSNFGEDFHKDAANFLMGRFFILYVLDQPDCDSADDYAYLAIQNKSSLESLKTFEDINRIDYSSLSGFLKTFGEALYNGEGINMATFNTAWCSCYGDSTPFAIEYVPFLLHFLFAVLHGAVLGGTLRLSRHKDSLMKLGLSKLYNAVSDVLKSA